MKLVSRQVSQSEQPIGEQRRKRDLTFQMDIQTENITQEHPVETMEENIQFGTVETASGSSIRVGLH